MEQLQVRYEHLGRIAYKDAWDYQESLMQKNLDIKKTIRDHEIAGNGADPIQTENHFLLCEHNPVFTLGKSGAIENLLVNNQYLIDQGIEFFKTNRGGDITFHGPEQIVGYPILDLERVKPDIVLYMRNLEEMIIRTLAEYGIEGTRSDGETGVWIDVDIPQKARKICAMGVRTSRWITMHGFALNVNTDLKYFNMIIPCGIQHKQVTSMEKELGHTLPMTEVEAKIRRHFEDVFQVQLQFENLAI
ncbi:octanoyltransferase [Filimonas sp.]|jgi:lipoyl(octanoyl) transferase|nr:octanoyltransferase [Filimonas sp.]